MAGSSAFLSGLLYLTLLADLSQSPRERLFDLNVALGSALVLLSMGGLLVYLGTSSLGGASPGPTRLFPAWPLLLFFPVLVVLGQVLVNEPETASWLFPLVNLGIVSLPSLFIALTVAHRYQRFNAWAWPWSDREFGGGIMYGAIGAIGIAGVINTLYLVIAGAILINAVGEGESFELAQNLRTLPRGWGIAFDLSVLSLCAPLNEEFWKGMLVAFFFYRRGGAARCFAWGVLAGAGFNIFETFNNSLFAVDPEQFNPQHIGDDWWLFAVVRGGTSALHSAATGLSALAFYGLLRHERRYLIGYPAGVLLHGTWNFLAYVLGGDAYFSEAGPDSTLLDVLAIAGLAALALACLALLWELPRRLRDRQPAPIYAALGMVPAASLPAPPVPAAHVNVV